MLGVFYQACFIPFHKAIKDGVFFPYSYFVGDIAHNVEILRKGHSLYPSLHYYCSDYECENEGDLFDRYKYEADFGSFGKLSKTND